MLCGVVLAALSSPAVLCAALVFSRISCIDFSTSQLSSATIFYDFGSGSTEVRSRVCRDQATLCYPYAFPSAIPRQHMCTVPRQQKRGGWSTRARTLPNSPPSSSPSSLPPSPPSVVTSTSSITHHPSPITHHPSSIPSIHRPDERSPAGQAALAASDPRRAPRERFLLPSSIFAAVISVASAVAIAASLGSTRALSLC